jgi:hypothetical protein
MCAAEMRCRSGCLRRPQNRLLILKELIDALAEFERSRGGHESTPGPDEERIADGFTYAGQRAARITCVGCVFRNVSDIATL